MYGDKSSSSKKLLAQDKSVTMHTRNVQILATDMFKKCRNISPPVLIEIFHQHDIKYNLQINSDLPMPKGRSLFHGSRSISHLVPKIWDIVPSELKE